MNNDKRKRSLGREEPEDTGALGDGEATGGQEKLPMPSPGPLPAELVNWHVVEIEGEATTVERDEVAGEVEDFVAAPVSGVQPLPDRVDQVVVLMLPKRALTLTPGERDTLTASVMNNGSRAAVFDLQIEGNVDPGWFPDLPLRLALQPGERKTLTFQVSPPRLPAARAGDHACAVAAHASAYPGRYSRAGFVLTLAPFSAFRLGALQPEQVTASWWKRSATAAMSLANLGNHRAEFLLAGADRQRLCAFEFTAPGDIYPQPGRASVWLEPGESALIDVTVMPRRLPFVGLFVQPAVYRVAARMVDGEEGGSRQVVQGRIAATALVGPWQLAGAAGLAVMGLIGLGLTGLLVLLALRVGVNRPPVVREDPPVVALLVSIDQPLPARETPGAGQAATEAQAGQGAVIGGGAPGLPLVQPDQVTAPGMPAAQPLQPVQPLVVAPPPTAGMTYAQMFQEIAGRYDLDWRQLAAQGYVESGFDAAAVGRQGSLGLMQIQPATWQEWAPIVDATDPFDSYSSVLVAAVYLDYLRAELGKRGFPQTEWMLAAYNWGPDRTLDLLASGGAWDDLPPEVREYAADVLRIAQSIPAN
jgi:hypothetical protein